ncbi:hypothetical protein QMK30_00075 [Streptomyces sp. H27-C3]|nr:hypothetical protein [Streptomyces sp. H27-C3]
MTLLVLDTHVTSDRDTADFRHMLHELLPKIGACALSFTILASLWGAATAGSTSWPSGWTGCPCGSPRSVREPSRCSPFPPRCFRVRVATPGRRQLRRHHRRDRSAAAGDSPLGLAPPADVTPRPPPRRTEDRHGPGDERGGIRGDDSHRLRLPRRGDVELAVAGAHQAGALPEPAGSYRRGRRRTTAVRRPERAGSCEAASPGAGCSKPAISFASTRSPTPVAATAEDHQREDVRP